MSAYRWRSVGCVCGLLSQCILLQTELIDFKTRRVAAFRKNLVELAELELKHAKVLSIQRNQPLKEHFSWVSDLIMWGGCSVGEEQAAFLIERLAGLSSLHPCSIKHFTRTSPFTYYRVSPAGEPPAAAGLSGHPERKHLTVWYCIHPAGCPPGFCPAHFQLDNPVTWVKPARTENRRQDNWTWRQIERVWNKKDRKSVVIITNKTVFFLVFV